VVRSIAQTEGVLALYKGLAPSLAGIAPYIAINFCTFDVLKVRGGAGTSILSCFWERSLSHEQGAETGCFGALSGVRGGAGMCRD
jgi:hypothetical protein